MMQPPALVLLVGFMGAGKTTVGRELERTLQWCFYDLDALIEARTGSSVATLFAEQGEPAFRKLELQSLRELLDSLEDEPAVIALGGGAFAQESIRQTIRDRSATVVFLHVDLDEAVRRCASAPGTRPLMRDANQMNLLYEERLPFYRTAHFQVQTGGKLPSEIAQEIASKLQLAPSDQEVR
jgi:shikimate kinase